MARYIDAMPVLVNLGCGARFHPDWVNLDVSPVDPSVRHWDILRGLPLAAGSADAIYSAHVLEHLPPAEGVALVRECTRALRPGGILRFGVPDLEQLAIQYLAALRESREGVAGASDRYEWAVMELIDQMVRHRSGGQFVELFSRPELPVLEHAITRWGDEARDLRTFQLAKRAAAPTPRPSLVRRLRRKVMSTVRPVRDDQRVGAFRLGGEPHLWMYDSYSLGRLMELAGLIDVKPMPLLSSRIDGWLQYGLEGVEMPYKPDTVVVEGVAP